MLGPMQVALLGALVVATDKGEVTLGAAKQRAVIEVLALRAGRPVSLESLSAGLWGDSPPITATKALQTYVSQLRRVLPPHCIATVGDGYALEIDAGSVDAARFEKAARSSAEVRAKGELPAAAATLVEGLQLWRGRPCPELTEHSWATAEVVRLEEVRRGAEEDLIEVRLALGEHARLVGDLEAAVAAEPLRERRWAQLMLALYRCGRQADALRAFQRLRTILADQLGLEAGERPQELEAAILAHDPALLWQESDAPSRELISGTVRPRATLVASTTMTVSVLCTDLADATELRARLGEEAADALQRKVDGHFRAAVMAAHGSVVRGSGDGLLAIFESAGDAMTAAAAIQRNATLPTPHDVDRAASARVGMSAGDVSVERGDVLGVPVLEAQRLCTACQPGQVLVTDAVRSLTRGRRGYRFEAVGELTLTGISSPVAPHQVLWERSPIGPPGSLQIDKTPLPGVLATAAIGPFVGRRHELGHLKRSWGASRDGRGCRVALLGGEPGVGKTRTAAELAREAYLEGTIVLSGSCDEDLAVPYQPFVEALQFYTLHGGDRLGRLRGELTRLVPELGHGVSDFPRPVVSDPRTEEYRLYEAVALWLIEASQPSGLVLVLDDLHWATKSTLSLLVHLVGRATSEPAARLWVLGTYRDSELDESRPLAALLADLRRLPGVERLKLSGLSLEEVVALVEGISGTELSADGRCLAESAFAETDGNPFFVAEVLRHLVETGARSPGGRSLAGVISRRSRSARRRAGRSAPTGWSLTGPHKEVAISSERGRV